MGAISRGGRAAGVIVAAVAINTALTSSVHASSEAEDYARHAKSGDTTWLEFDAINIAIDVQSATGNYYMTYEALDILLR